MDKYSAELIISQTSNQEDESKSDLEITLRFEPSLNEMGITVDSDMSALPRAYILAAGAYKQILDTLDSSEHAEKLYDTDDLEPTRTLN